jgi:hypothetical protein
MQAESGGLPHVYAIHATGWKKQAFPGGCSSGFLM